MLMLEPGEDPNCTVVEMNERSKLSKVKGVNKEYKEGGLRDRRDTFWEQAGPQPNTSMIS